MDIGTKIKNRRLELGISQSELAELCGYRNKTSISKIEKNLAVIPFDRMEVIAEALKVDPLFFMSDDLPVNRQLNSKLAMSDVKLLTKISQLNDTNRQIADGMIDVLINSQSKH